MFWKVLDTLARRGGSGSACAEQGLPNGGSESWSHTSSQPSRLAGPVALATHSWGILVLSPSLGARETPTHTPANWRMSSIYTWLWECVTHGFSAPHSQYVHPRVQHLTKREGSCVQPSPWPQEPKVTHTARPKISTYRSRDMAHVLSEGRWRSVYKNIREFSAARQHDSFLPCLVPLPGQMAETP